MVVSMLRLPKRADGANADAMATRLHAAKYSIRITVRYRRQLRLLTSLLCA